MSRIQKTEHEEKRARAERLTSSRKDAGYTGAQSAAEHFGWNVNSYKAHEAGRNGFGIADAKKYAEAFHVTADWLTFGDRSEKPHQGPAMVPLVGYVGAGAQAVLYGEGHELNDEVTAPKGATDKTVAVEIRGTSLGELFDEWLVFYDDVRDPPGGKQLGKLCICWLADRRVLIKKLKKSHIDGFFTLLSNTEPPIYDVAVLAAALVINMAPR